MTPDPNQHSAEHHPTDDPRYAVESGEPTLEGRQPGRPDDAADVEGAGPDTDHRRGNDAGEQDWESGRQQAL